MLFIAAELAKRGIPAAILPEGYKGDDIFVGEIGGSKIARIQVKTCHPERGNVFHLSGKVVEDWKKARKNEFVACVWLGKERDADVSKCSPAYWITTKNEMALILERIRRTIVNYTTRTNKMILLAPDEASHLAPKPHGTKDRLPTEWRENWRIFDEFRPKTADIDE